MTVFATTSDLAGRLGRPLTSAEAQQAAAYLEDAADVIEARFPSIPDPAPRVVRKVCCAMVLRVLRNPDGKREEAVDDYRYVIDSSRSTGEVYLADNEAEEIAAALRPRRTGVFEIHLGPFAPADGA